jgi:micrococcal nuclease
MNVVDGDTIDVDGIRVRLIGINTPETKDPNKSVECYGPEATAQMQKLVSNQRVCLLADTISDDVDIYGRKLRYVLLSDGTNVNAEMLK